ncbi:13648_t:CDS:2, partial [Acaulospora morrowiae]
MNKVEVNPNLCHNLTYFKASFSKRGQIISHIQLCSYIFIDLMKEYRKIDDNIMLRMNTTNTHSEKACAQFFQQLADAYSQREQILDKGLEEKQKALDDDPYDSDLKNQMFVDESK